MTSSPVRGLRLLYTVSLTVFGLGLVAIQYLTSGTSTQIYPNTSEVFRDFPVIVVNGSIAKGTEGTSEIEVEEWLSKKHHLMTFVPPAEYHGAKLEGWTPDKNRNVELYIKPKEKDFMITPEVISGCKILIVVHSTLNSFHSRSEIRNSWLNFENYQSMGIAVVFLVGRTMSKGMTEDAEVNLLKKVKMESDRFGDIIQADLVEHYQNLSLKTMFTLKYFLEPRHFENGKIPDYLFKIDDDTFVNLPMLWKTIQTHEPSNSSRYILGAVLGTPKKPSVPVKNPVQRGNGKKEVSKWWCPSYMFSGSRYPIFVSGSGYIISRAAAPCLYEAGLRLPYFHLEDVFVTGFAADWCEIPKITSKAFHAQYFVLEKVDLSSDLLYHYVMTKSKDLLFKLFNYDNIVAKLSKLEKPKA